MKKLMLWAGYPLALLGGLMFGYWLVTVLTIILFDVALLPNDPYGNKSMALLVLGMGIGGGGIALAVAGHNKENDA